jgi:hypothetical protein
MGLTALAAVWMGAKPTGYLARIGPAPLRFQAPAKGIDQSVVLPPLAMKDPEPAPELIGPPPPTNVVSTVEPQPAPTPAPAPAPVETQPTFTPQMLLRFFNGSGTNQEFNGLVPYQFSPPPTTSIPAPPSKAVYTTK